MHQAKFLSMFRGGVGSEMIEVVPFFHILASRIVSTIDPLNEGSAEAIHAIIATTIFSFMLSSILTGAAFFALGYFKMGSLIGFFPR